MRPSLQDAPLLKSPTKSVNDTSDQNDSNPRSTLTYISYCLLQFCDGCVEPLAGALYVQLESQLSTSSSNIAYMLSSKAVFQAVGAIITALMVQYIQSSHKYVSIICILTAIAISACYYCKSLYLMFIIMSTIGYFIGTACASYPAWVFRLYPHNQTQALFFCFVVQGISKTLIPLIIDASTSLFNSYGPSFNLISFFMLITAILLWVLPTPKHDELRHLRSSINDTNAELINEKLKENNTIQRYSKCLLCLLTMMTFTVSAFQSGAINFIQKYGTNYLNKGENVGRYLISCYYFGQLFYRFVVAIFCRKLNPVYSILSSNVILVFIGLLLIGFGYVLWPDTHSNVWILYVIFINMGIWASPVYPCVIRWAEMIQTVSGLITGLLMIAFSLGDAFNVTTVGLLIKEFGAQVIPLPINGFICACLIQTIIAVIMYRKFSSLKSEIVQSL